MHLRAAAGDIQNDLNIPRAECNANLKAQEFVNKIFAGSLVLAPLSSTRLNSIVRKLYPVDQRRIDELRAILV